MWYSILTTFAKIIAVPTVLFMSLAGYNTQVLSPAMATQEAHYLQTSQQVFGNTQPFAGNTYNLAGSGVSNSASTIVLTSLTIKQTGQPIQTSDLVGTGGIFYVTLEPGSNTKQEIVGCTAVSQGTNSASLTGCVRGLAPIFPYTASTTLQFTHAGGSSVIFSDPPQLFNQYAALSNTQTITGAWTFATTPTITNIAVNPTDAVNYQTVLNTAISGAGTSTENVMGISQLATSAQVSAGTASSTQGRPLVIKSGSATSTCQVATPGVLAASSVTGKLSQTCFDSSQSYTFTNSNTFASTTFAPTATTTLSGTTTIAANTSNKLSLNTVPLSFPSTVGAAGTSWVNNGTGGVIYTQPASLQYSFASTSQSSIVLNKTITSAQLSIPAGILTASSTVTVSGVITCSTGGSGGNCTVSLIDTNSNQYCSQTLSPGTTGAEYMSFSMNSFANGSLSSQSGSMNGIINQQSGSPIDGSGACGGSVNWANATNFEIKYVTSNTTGVTGTLSPFVITVRP